MHTRIRWTSALAWLLTGSVAIAAAAPVATVGKESITQASLEQTMEDVAGREVLRRLIDEQLVLQAGQAAGVLVSEEEAAAELSRVAKAFPNAEAFDAAMNEARLDRAALIRRLRSDLTLENLAMATWKPQPTEEELVAHYARFRETFGRPTFLRARHISVLKEHEAVDLLGELNRGADFGALARKFSTDMATRDRGGDLGETALTRPYARGMVTLTAEPFPISMNGFDSLGPTTDRLTLWQFALRARDPDMPLRLVGPVKTTFGYSLIQLTDIREGEVPSFPEVRDLVRSHLFRFRYPLRPEVLRWELRHKAQIETRTTRYTNMSKPKGDMKWTIDPTLIDPLHPSLLNLRVYGLQDTLRLYLMGDLMQDYDALRLTTKNHAYAAAMSTAGNTVLRMDRAVDEVQLKRLGDDGWTKYFAEAVVKYREGSTTNFASYRLTADILSSPDGYRWKVTQAELTKKESIVEGSR